MRDLSRNSATFVAGLVAGTLDILYAIVFWHFRGVRPIRILQSVASGLLGSAAYEGGIPTATLGLLLHYFIALSAAAVFAVAARRLTALIRHWATFGILYGLVVYAVMNYLVLPLSAFPGKAPTRPIVVATGLLVHMFFIGLPIAWFTQRSTPGR